MLAAAFSLGKIRETAAARQLTQRLVPHNFKNETDEKLNLVLLEMLQEFDVAQIEIVCTALNHLDRIIVGRDIVKLHDCVLLRSVGRGHFYIGENRGLSTKSARTGLFSM